MSDLHHQVNSYFHTNTKDLLAQLGVQNLFSVLEQMTGFSIEGTFPDQKVIRTGEQLPFDYIPSSKPTQQLLGKATKTDDDTAWEPGVVTFWNSSYGKVMTQKGRELLFDPNIVVPNGRVGDIRRGMEVFIVVGVDGKADKVRMEKV